MGWCSCGPASERCAAAGAAAQHAEREAQCGRAAACRARERRGDTSVLSESRRVLPLALTRWYHSLARTYLIMSVRGTPSRGELGGSSLAGLRGRAAAGAGRSSAADSRTYAKHGELAHRERHVCARSLACRLAFSVGRRRPTLAVLQPCLQRTPALLWQSREERV